MKKLLLFAALAVFGLTNVNAQEEKVTTGGLAKGDIAISGGFGFGTTSTGDFKMNSFSFMPAAGFMITDNIAVGAKFGITSGKDEDGSGDETKFNSFNAGAFGQYYFTPANQFSFLVTLGAGFTSAKEEFNPNNGPSSEAKENGFYVGLAPGISYWVSDHFALQAHVGVLGYETSKPDADNAESTDSFNFGVNFKDVSFCLVYKF